MTRTTAFLLSAALLAVGPVQAQTSAPASGLSRGLQSDQPMDVSSEAFERVESRCQTILTGNVEILQGQNRLRSPRLDVFYSPSARAGSNACGDDVARIEATGPVYYVTPQQNARGDAATFLGPEEQIIMTGNVVLTQGQDVLTGQRLVVNTRTNDARMEAGGGRVRAVIFPSNRPPAAPAAAPAG